MEGAVKQKVKIQVGFSKREENENEDNNLVNEVKNNASVVDQQSLESITRSNMRMVDFCDSAYMKKHAPKHRKEKKTADANANTNPAKDGNKSGPLSSRIPSSSTSTGGSSSSSSSVPTAGAKRSRHEEVEKVAPAQGPQVAFINGEMVVIESSLVVQEPSTTTTGEPEGEYEEVIEGTHATATYRSFQRKQRQDRWGIEETRHFFAALRQCGTEFSLMQSFFPGRTRKQLKLKFLKEEKEHPELIKETLKLTVPLDIQPFSTQFQKHPSEMTEEEREMINNGITKATLVLMPDLPQIFDTSRDNEDDIIDI